jgi:hypothetical protein
LGCPWLNFNYFVEAHDYINYNLIVGKALLTALDDTFRQIEVCEGTTVDQYLVVDSNDWEDNWNGG